MKKEKEDKALRKAVLDLPEHAPPAGMWDDIASDLETRVSPEKKTGFVWLKYAAVFALVISAGLLGYNSIYSGSDISFDEELSDLDSKIEMVQVADSGFELFLEEECTGYREVCEMPEFKTLITQLTQVEAEVTNIANMIETTGFDEFLYKAKTKADQETVRIKKELVKLLRG
ncbi:MAG: hypothetical protein HEP71_20815 [Roseivirga sp.]|nr:hypothetical protein [Roseivirga sp.]